MTVPVTCVAILRIICHFQIVRFVFVWPAVIVCVYLHRSTCICVCVYAIEHIFVGHITIFCASVVQQCGRFFRVCVCVCVCVRSQYWNIIANEKKWIGKRLLHIRITLISKLKLRDDDKIYSNVKNKRTMNSIARVHMSHTIVSQWQPASQPQKCKAHQFSILL